MEPLRIKYRAMSNLSIKNVPEPVVEKLRRRASENHRSLQGELMAIVCRAADDTESQQQRDEPHREASGWKSAARILAENKARWGGPDTTSPRAVDIIRRERDAR